MEFALARRIAADCLDFLLPQHCAVCDGFGSSLHPGCLERLPRAEMTRCQRCWRPGPATWCERCAEMPPPGAPGHLAFDALRTPFRFAGDARRVLLEAKFRGIAAHLGPLAEAAAEAVPAEWHVDAVVPVPLAPGRQRRRGFNQAALLASGVGRVLGVHERVDLVRRTRSTAPQASLSAEERWKNLHGAFEVHGMPPERVLVVDDITTTGATLSAVAAALKAAGAGRVYALAVAHED